MSVGHRKEKNPRAKNPEIYPEKKIHFIQNLFTEINIQSESIKESIDLENFMFLNEFQNGNFFVCRLFFPTLNLSFD